jgi:hypothetical protein
MGTAACRQRRQPEATTLHRVLSAHLQTFLARADDAAGVRARTRGRLSPSRGAAAAAARMAGWRD